MSQRHFFRAFLRNCAHVGAIAPSSRELACVMVDWLDWDDTGSVIEFGPGTGVITEVIADRMRPGMTCFAIERDPELAAIARERCPSVPVHNGCVSDVRSFCEDAGLESVDAVLSGLPWASFSPEMQDRCLEAMFEVLPPGGKFATFAYWQGLALPAGQRFRSFVKAHFSNVEQSVTVWRNLPPAFVYCCER